MTVRLFSHNQKAYEAAVAMLEKTGKAAVIHPTGTGKSFIAFKLVADNPDKNFLWLSPSEYIFKTQCENLHHAGQESPFANLRFYTYAKLTYLTPDDMARIAEQSPAFIILDEFHRAGAEQWSQSVQQLLTACRNAKLLGLSATNIRYLDNRRDMAEELFEGNVASEMTLGEAIAKKILPAPKYVCALYEYQDEMDAYRKRVKKLAGGVRESAEERLEMLKRALEHAEGLDKIFAKHIPKRDARLIVFCANIEHMRSMAEESKEWFAAVDETPHIYTIFSDNPEASKAFDDFKRDGSDHLKLLFCIDMLNEGIHVENIDGVVMLRPTISPIIYKQQLGRALSAGGKAQPLVFDIVNNFDGLYSVGALGQEMAAALHWNDAQSEDIWHETGFDLLDEVREIRQLFRQLDEVLSSGWEVHFNAAKRYFERYGDLDVPKRYVTEDGLSLGVWLMTQRRVHTGKCAGTLTPAQVMRLEAIGMVWENRLELSWNRNFEAARAYFEKYGNLRVPAKYVDEDGFALGRWIVNLRTAYVNGCNAQLTRENIARLDEIGMVWNCADEQWELYYLEALKYFERYGDLLVPHNYVTESGSRLGSWLQRMRGIYRGKANGAALSAGQIERLETIGMVWGDRNNEQWLSAYAKAEEYYRRYGDLNVPFDYVTPDGTLLGKWVTRQRSNRKSAKGSRVLTAERIALLDGIGMDWRTEDAWEHRYRLAEEYLQENGDLNIPAKYKTSDGIWLGKWLYRQRRALDGADEKQPLTKTQQEKLAALGI